MSENSGSETYQRVVAFDDIPEGKAQGFVVNDWPVLVSKLNGEAFAVLDRCSHQASNLSSGARAARVDLVPLHGALFDLKTGICAGGHYRTLRIFPVQVDDGWVSVAVPAEAPGIDELPI